MFRNYLALVALGVIWGSNFIFMKWATDLISPTQTVFLRVLFGFIPLLLVAIKIKVLTRQQLKYLHHFAIMSILATTLYYYGFVAGTSQLPTSIAGLLSGSIPIFTFICAFLFLRQDRPTGIMALGVLLGFIGIVVSARPWSGVADAELAGTLWMIMGTLSLGVSFVYAQRFLSPLRLPPLALATWQTGFATLTLLVLTPFDGIGAISNDLGALSGAIFGLGIVGTGGAFFIYYFVIEKLGPVRAAGATYIAPVVAVLIGALIGEEITGSVVLALCLILGGVVLIQTGKRKTANPTKTKGGTPINQEENLVT